MQPAYLLSLFSVVLSACAQNVLNLGGPGWTLSNTNRSIKVPATLPSQQYIDLFHAGVIGDPLFGLNNTDQSWIPLENWTYTSGPLTQLHKWSQSRPVSYSTYLVFQGLDTFAHIELCNQAVGDTNNQFRQYVFDVTSNLRSCRGSPRLTIEFGSPINIAYNSGSDPANDPLAASLDSCTSDNRLGCKAFARKEQNDAGWDWSPSLEPSGPWRPIYAVQILKQQVYINNALVDIYRQGQRNNLPPDQSRPWVFNASLDFVGTLPHGASMSVTLTDSKGNTVLEQRLSGVYSSANTVTGSTIIDPSKVQLWWPNGMGSQTLYNATIQLTGPWKLPIAHVQRRVGFRTIVLNQNPITSIQISQGVAPGANWHFEVNGQEFYAKGSNFVPPDVFWPRVNDTRITRLFELAQGAGMNMFRVWSSGAYLDDWIYDIADEMGILLWSEFEFSDAEYSNATSFLENYEAEAYYNVRRVNYHPSLALWVGGNELEAIQLLFFFNPSSPSEAMQQYQQIFEELLIKCVYANTKSISYIPSSTYNGYLSLDFDSVRPQTPRYLNSSGPEYLYNDTDAYNYNATTLFDINTYPVGRFADEFGFHSMPSIYTWEQEAARGELYYPSETVINHNRHYPFGASGTTEQQSLAGIAEMTAAVEQWLPRPIVQEYIANFSAWCWSTQVVQADDIGHQIAFYRRGSGRAERQLGSLYWMFDDLWAAPTWASVEANNRQKVLYYAAKDLYQPVIVGAYFNQSDSELEIWATSDLWTLVSGSLTYSWTDWHGNPLKVEPSPQSPEPYVHGIPDVPSHRPPFRPMQGSDGSIPQAASLNSPSDLISRSSSSSVPFKVGAINSTQILRYSDLKQSLATTRVNPTNALLHLSITATPQGSAQNSPAGQTYTHKAVFHAAPLSQAKLPDPGLTLTRDGNTFTVKATKAVAAWVWLEYGTNAVQGYWSDNGFWLAKGEARTVTFTVWEDWSGGAWVESVFVQSLWDMTQQAPPLVKAS